MNQVPVDEKKDVQIWLRLPQSLYDIFVAKAQRYSLKRSEAARLAIAEWSLEDSNGNHPEAT